MGNDLSGRRANAGSLFCHLLCSLSLPTPHSPCSTLSSFFLFLFFCPLAYSSLVTLNRSLRLHLCNCVCSVTREIVVAGVFASVSFISSPSCELRVCQWRNDRYSKTRNIGHIELGNSRVYIDDSIETRALSSVSRCQGSSLNERCFYPRQFFSTFHLWWNAAWAVAHLPTPRCSVRESEFFLLDSHVHGNVGGKSRNEHRTSSIMCK